MCVGSSQTSGFPSLEELRRNGSLLERYSTHDGELRSVPGVRATCSTGNQRISKITFIALPGSGMGHTQLLFGDLHIDLSVASNTFGDFGYELTLPMTINIGINEGPVQLSILHPPYEESGMRLLHQVGTEARNICWRLVDSASESENCHHDYDYPLLAIETGIYMSPYTELFRVCLCLVLRCVVDFKPRLLSCPRSSAGRVLCRE